jgi:hypothetical protein
MIPRKVRLFGLFFGASTFLVTGGIIFIYGILVFYVSMPSSPSAAYVLAPVNTLLFAVISNRIVWVVLVVGLSIFTVEVYQNGLLNLDTRIRHERMKDWRREKAKKSEAWEPPPEDRETTSKYQELLEEQSGRLTVAEDSLVWEDGQPSVIAEVRNTSSATYRNVVVKIGFVDRNDDIAEIRKATRPELRPNNTWKFQLFYNGNPDRVAGYKISSPRGTPSKT